VYWTAKGLGGKCTCQNGCDAILDAVRAVEILADAWERPPFSRVQAGIEADLRWDPFAEPRELGTRPYDGPARDTCEADLVPLDIPPWAYDEQGIRRAVVDAEIARDIWCDLQLRLNRLLSGPMHADPRYPPPTHAYYRASWEPDRGMTHAAFDLDRLIDPDEDD
jgi:hypothetical protein